MQENLEALKGFLAMHIAKEQTRLLDAKPKELCAISQMIEKPQHLICLTHCSWLGRWWVHHQSLAILSAHPLSLSLSLSFILTTHNANSEAPFLDNPLLALN